MIAKPKSASRSGGPSSGSSVIPPRGVQKPHFQKPGPALGNRAKLAVGSIARVTRSFKNNTEPYRILNIGERGEVTIVDDQGDALIAFGAGEEWILKENFSDIHVEGSTQEACRQGGGGGLSKPVVTPPVAAVGGGGGGAWHNEAATAAALKMLVKILAGGSGSGESGGSGWNSNWNTDSKLKVWVGGLSDGTTWKELEAHCEKLTGKKSKWVQVFGSPGKKVGEVVYHSEQDVAEVINQVDFTQLNGVDLQCDTWDSKEEGSQEEGRAGSGELQTVPR